MQVTSSKNNKGNNAWNNILSCILRFIKRNVVLVIAFLLAVATSFIAASLMFVRSPYYALGYTLNDLVLIVLWTLASIADISYLPMVICFATFTVNDTYGFISWYKRKKRQQLSE